MPQIEINRKLASWAEVLDKKYRYIFIRGGRTSGKSHEVAGYLSERSFVEKGFKAVCLREIQKSIKHSSKTLIEQKLKEFVPFDEYYKSIESEIKKTTPNDGGFFLFQGMNDLTKDNVKSLEDFDLAWFEESQNASFATLKTLRPTIRKEGSQIIFTWNPFLPTDPIDEFCSSIQNEPDVLVIHVNYTENPFLSDTALREIEIERESSTPEEFEHIYLGSYDTTFQGHYYAQLVQKARDDSRICEAPRKAGVDIIMAWDLGLRDSTAIWVAQVVGLQIRVIDYYENHLEDLEHYVQWIKDNDYTKATTFLPHDSKHERLGMKGSIKEQLRLMGVQNIKDTPNVSIDSGMSMAKNLLKECYFDKDKCKNGLSALSHYHAKYDEVKRLFTEVHDWSSHGSDAFRYLALALNSSERVVTKNISMRVKQPYGQSYMGY